jgi:hypothetical protein
MRSLFLIGLLFGIGCHSEKGIRPVDRSWSMGEIVFEQTTEGNVRRIHVRGKWPGANTHLWIRYELSLLQPGSKDAFLTGSSQPLHRFERDGTGSSQYSGGDFRHFDQSKPYQAVLDYEIWLGEPNQGKLLTKQSAFSKMIHDEPK